MALAVTPAIRILRWPALVDVRRMIGVTALIYTLIHIVFYFGMRSWNWPVIGPEMVTRWALIWGTLSTIGLIVLGATSLDAAIERMGVKGWQRLHNTNYAISGLAVLHVMLARGTYPEQYLLSGIFAWLMAWRDRSSPWRKRSAIPLKKPIRKPRACLAEARAAGSRRPAPRATEGDAR